jgi:putative sigma-54 modulation protein
MHIHLITHHLTLTEGLHDFAVRKIAGPERLDHQIVGAHVVLRYDSSVALEQSFSVRVRLAVRGLDVFASDVDGDLYAAIDKVVDKLASGLRQRKSRLQSRHRRRTPIAGIAA